jgi:hypothetical protein
LRERADALPRGGDRLGPWPAGLDFQAAPPAAVPEAGSGVKYSVPQRLRLGAGQVGEQWSIEAHHHIRGVTFGEDASASRTGSGPVNLATIRATVITALKDAGYPHIPEGRRDHTTPAGALRLHGLD